MAAAISGSPGCLIKGLTWMLPVLCLLAILGELVQGELRRCYTCGPLAEQPHRSRRPPACATFNALGGTYESECDPGHNACAIVATVHPYVESRICVKEHHDKCIRKYCNTTRTLKMVCSCQGDLCNAEKTSQINESFLKLTEDAINTTKPGTGDMTIENSTSHSTPTTTTFPNYEAPATGQNRNLTTISDSKATTPSLKIQPKADVSNEEDLDISVGEKHQPLPEPAALGGEQTPSSGHGAPVDDEEDTSEGSGGGFDAKSSGESNGPGVVKTTVRPTPKAMVTTTMPHNSAAYSVPSALIFSAIGLMGIVA